MKQLSFLILAIGLSLASYAQPIQIMNSAACTVQVTLLTSPPGATCSGFIPSHQTYVVPPGGSVSVPDPAPNYWFSAQVIFSNAPGSFCGPTVTVSKGCTGGCNLGSPPTASASAAACGSCGPNLSVDWATCNTLFIF
ncbi:hypothetical protein KFE98_17055 [bacterium SCSIO 12741]|nr:hypothetical protein KFE98_17055 [bacterium SCSIO 12741]